MRKLMVGVWMLMAGTCLAQQIDLKSLEKFAALATSKTEINMDESMVKSAITFLDDKKTEEGLAKKAAQGLKAFFLRAYEFDQKTPFKLDDLKPLLDQLKGPAWTSFLRAQESNEQTEIWTHRTNGQMDGLLLIAAESNEVVVMNAVGITSLADLSALGEFGNLAGAKVTSPLQTNQPTAPGSKPGTTGAGQKDDD